MQIKYLLRLFFNVAFPDAEKRHTRLASKGTQLGLAGFAIIFCLLSGNLIVVAQGPVFEWAKSMGGNNFDQANAITVDHQGNSYTTGLFRDVADFDPGPDSFMLTGNSVGNTLFVSKLDASGKFIWARSFGGNGKFHYAYSIAHDVAGNVYVAGYYYGPVDFDPGPDSFNLTPVGATTSDVFILKLDSAGNFVWAKSLGGASNDFAYYALTVDSFSNVYISGRAFGVVDFDPGPNVVNITPAGNGGYAFILKLNSNGEFIWVKDIGQTTRPLAVATGYSIAVDGMGNVYTTGSFRDSVDFDPGPGKAILVPKVGTDIFISKLDSAGNFVWAKNMGSTHTSRADEGLNIALDPARNVYITGTFNNTVDFDPGPNTFDLTTFSTQNSEIFILKLDNDGNFIWAKSISGSTNSAFEHNFSFSTILDKAGNSYTTGYFLGFADFDPGLGNTILNSNGLSDMFILKLNPAGEFVWVKQMGSADVNVARSSAFDGSGNIYTTGWFRGDSDFNPGTDPGDTAVLTSKLNSFDIVVVKLACTDTTSSIITDSADCNGYTLNDTTYMESGTYIQKRPNFVGCDSTITLHLTIIPKLDMDINITINVDELGTVEHFATYQWMLNGSIIPNATDSTYTVSENGKYQVIVTNERGCVDTSDIYEVTNIVGIGNSHYLGNQIKIYPNPTKDRINISSPVAVNLSLCSIDGRVIKQAEATRQISLDELTGGIYFLRIFDLDGNFIKTEKIVKAQ